MLSRIQRFFYRPNPGRIKLYELLGNVPLFSKLSRSEIKKIEPYLFFKSYKKGEILFRESTPGYALFIIQSGRISLRYEQANGQEADFDLLDPGSFIGELALFIFAKRNCSAVAHDDCEVLVLFKHEFHDFVGQFPAIGVKMLQEISSLLGEKVLDLMDGLREADHEEARCGS